MTDMLQELSDNFSDLISRLIDDKCGDLLMEIDRLEHIIEDNQEAIRKLQEER
tara:strand:- start:3006 stop:3164 length:159 start_codon:yes stop_codon:yes gene_type:complete